MKELEKYYFGHFNGHENELADFYKCSEADAAFAEMELRNINLQYQRDGLCVRILVLEQQAEKDRDLIAQMSYGAADEIAEMRRNHPAIELLKRLCRDYKPAYTADPANCQACDENLVGPCSYHAAAAYLRTIAEADKGGER